MILPILLWPDPRLTVRCAPVGKDVVGVAQLAADMLDTMYAAQGRGLAAPQVGAMLRLFVMDSGWKQGCPRPMVFVNPRLLPGDGAVALAVNTEACLSIPDREVRIARPARVRLAWQDLAGQPQEAVFTGFEAVCVQHEMDHLDGILCIDHPPALPEENLT
jgi:peptide deformylase